MKTVVGRAYTTGPKPDLQPRFPLEELRATWWLEKKPAAIVYDRDKKMLGVLLVEPSCGLEVGNTFRLPVYQSPAFWPLAPGARIEALVFESVDLEVGPAWALYDERRLSFTLRRGDLYALALHVFWPLEKPYFPSLAVLAAMARDYERRDLKALLMCMDSLKQEIRMRAAPSN